MCMRCVYLRVCLCERETFLSVVLWCASARFLMRNKNPGEVFGTNLHNDFYCSEEFSVTEPIRN